MRLFKEKPLPQLIYTLHLIDMAGDLILEHKRNRHYRPTRKDLGLFRRIEEALSETQSTAAYVTRCMRKRFNDEPEGHRKWRDENIPGDHYPPEQSG